MTRRTRPVEKRVATSLFAALMIIVFGVFMVITPWLATYGPEQEDESPWFWVPLGLLFIAVGGSWLRRAHALRLEHERAAVSMRVETQTTTCTPHVASREHHH